MQESIVHYGVRITVSEEADGTFSVYFSNTAGNFDDLNNVKALRGHTSVVKAFDAGKKFVEDHQWQEVAQVGDYSVKVRLWWNGVWGYGVHSDFSVDNGTVTGGFEEAKEAGIARAKQKIEEFEAELKQMDELVR